MCIQDCIITTKKYEETGNFVSKPCLQNSLDTQLMNSFEFTVALLLKAESSVCIQIKSQNKNNNECTFTNQTNVK
ncbi:hypothetical protein TTHERM_000354797 (macronuclear) [Tetrahymena thermophila SB210]|uniref:Uncharacterized protein n=1 Tax=Tetrahymena thermophila (strain SB210) TaxID=312017 RepID=W7XKV9_TETTS|nr:hypothetical protein TTHERM_000354797 [Tetrahymena thermophila SB210]EWS75274.1 hypothetical protein TTHERM_000354797 [Tetrahymena thermophila SB210]|eukprot:XP_012652265.1 hypothetical protein TTHERM_000354797 [Tetrahymena thermophila SB210]